MNCLDLLRVPQIASTPSPQASIDTLPAGVTPRAGEGQLSTAPPCSPQAAGGLSVGQSFGLVATDQIAHGKSTARLPGEAPPAAVSAAGGDIERCEYCARIVEDTGIEIDTDHGPADCREAEAQYCRDSERENPIPAAYAEA